ncbi:MAG: nucleotide pyrophosphohydrolase [Deltaproteobacteria bacterium]|nr:nucleotide pyrophosphohydrolase [Deltaproteobacteria bacterium]
MDSKKICEHLRSFAAARDWDQFHTPKNLVMALSGEVGELTEIFQWLTPEQSAAVTATPAVAENVRDELADVMLYVLRLSDVLGVDLEAAIWAKLAKNAAKYPVDLAKGRATKYTELKEP